MVEGVNYVLVLYLPVCIRIVNPRGKLDSVLPRCLLAKTEGRARILIPATKPSLLPVVVIGLVWRPPGVVFRAG